MKEWLNDAVFYEIYPQSFFDSNGDGIGDIEGITSHLSYVKGLGCNAIWLNPCFDSPFTDAGYDVRDYKTIAPRYGTNEDIFRLFREAHAMGMHVLLDLVPGHTSEEHEWFRESRLSSEGRYADRYIWTDSWFSYPEGMKGVAGTAPRDGVYVVNFFQSQPALNYGFLQPARPWQKPVGDPACLATEEAVYDVMRFWLKNGCDGFRVDMADSLVKNDDEHKTGTRSVWKRLTARLSAEFPDAVLVSEWNNPEASLSCGFDMDFLLDWYGNGLNVLLRAEDGPIFAARSKRSICDFLDDYLPRYEKTKSLGRYCLITGNHDTPRLSRSLSGSELKLALAFILMMPGNPFIYYGDELGMRYIEGLPSKEGGYTRTGSRTPMQWSSGPNLGFSTAPQELLYLPVDAGQDAPTADSAKSDPCSLFNLIRELTRLRLSETDLRDNSSLEFILADRSRREFVFRRGHVTAAFNPSTEEARVDGLLSVTGSDLSSFGADPTGSSKSGTPSHSGSAWTGTAGSSGSTDPTVLYALGGATVSDGMVVLPPQSFVIYGEKPGIE